MPDKTFTNPLTDEHVQEAERLKKAWFEHMFNSMARLGETVDNLKGDLQETKNLLYKELFDIKDILRRESTILKKDVDADIDKAEQRVNKLIDELNKKVDVLSITDKDNKSDIKKDIDKLKSEFSKEFDIIKKESLTPLKEDVIKLRITMAKWGGLGGVIAATIFSIIKWVLPFILKIVQQVGL